MTVSSDAHIFSLANQSLKLDSADDIAQYLAPLLSSDKVQEIHLGGNTYGAPACAQLASVLQTKKTLRVANFADIFTARLLSEIPPALSSLLTSLLPLQNLQSIDLSDNAFGLNTQGPLVSFLEQHVPLRHLILNNNGLGPHAGVLIADALTALAARKDEARKAGGNRADGQSDIPYLETIVCGRNRLESGSMTAWARAFRAHARVATVRLVQNGIRPEGIAVVLREGLGGCDALRILDLQDNTCTAVGVQALTDVVGGWTSLRELGVGDCVVGPKCWKMIVDALGQGTNRELKILKAQYDEVNARGVQQLLDVIQAGKLPALRRVELNGNKFSEADPAIVALKKALEERRAAQESNHSHEKHNNDNGIDDDDNQDYEWGLDELSDLEDDDDDDDDDDDEKEDEEEDDESEDKAGSEEEKGETELKAEAILRDLDTEEQSNVPQRRDEDVDSLADRLSKTGIQDR